MKKNLGNKMAKATKWAAITEIGTKLISPITNAILARLLAPEMFGVVATLSMIISFSELFTDAGFQKYLIQHEFDNEEDLNLSTNVAFWTNLLFSILIWAIIAVFATPIAKLLGSEGNELAIIIISAEIPLYAFTSIQMARYRRDFDFKNLFVARMAIALVPLVVTVPAALVFHSYWALIIGTLAKDVLNAIVLTISSRWKPSFQYKISKLKDMLSFSMWTMAENVTIWLTTNSGTLIVSNTLGSYYLGLYKTTISTINGYYRIIQNSTTPVLFSALSRCQDDEEEYWNVFFKFQRMVAILVLPLGFGIFVYRELATLILLGNQWMETADFMGMRALVRSIMIVFSHYNSEAFRSKGRPRLSALAQMLYLIVLVPTLFLSAQKGFVELTVANCIASLSLLVFTSIISRIALELKIIDVLKNVWPSMVSSAIMAVAGIGFLMISEEIVWQIISVFLCVVVYALCMLIIPAGRRQLAEIPILCKIFRLKTNG